MPSTATDRLQGLTTSVAVKASCRLKTTANHGLSGLAAVDGETPEEGDRILVGSNTDGTENGIYNASAGDWTRALDFNGSLDAVGGTIVTVIEGTVNSNSYWRVAGVGPVAIGTDEIEFQAGLISDSGAIIFLPAGDNAVATTAQTKLRRIQIDIEDRGGGTGVSDNTAALRNALSVLAAVGGGILQFQAGTYNFASAALGGTGIEIPPNVTIRGRGMEATQFVVTGSTACYFFLDEDSSSNIRICDLTVRGNSTATDSGIGGFLWVHQAAGVATATVENVVVENVRLENFGGDQWVWFYCSHGTHKIMTSGVDNLQVRSEEGNCRDETSIAVISGAVIFTGFGVGRIEDCFARRLDIEGTWIKQGFGAFGGVTGLDVPFPKIRNIFQGHGIADQAAYAGFLYDLEEGPSHIMSGIVTNTSIVAALMTSPFSCGIYLAGSKYTEIVVPRISGQGDTDDTQIPKAAIALNGPNHVKIIAPELSGNWGDFSINGIATAYEADGTTPAYDTDMDIQIRGGSGINATGISIKVKPGILTGASLFGGVHFSDFEVKGAAGGALACYPTATKGLTAVSFDNCRFGTVTSGSASAIILNKNAVATCTYSVSFNRCLVTATGSTGQSFNASGANAGLVEIVECGFDAAAAYHLVMDACTNVRIEDDRFGGSVSSGNNCELAGTQGVFFGNYTTNASALVAASGTALGRQIPAFTGHNGKRVQNAIQAIGDPAYWEHDGTAWRKEGIVGIAQAAARADTTAADLAALKVDFNDLLAKLRTANLLDT